MNMTLAKDDIVEIVLVLCMISSAVILYSGVGLGETCGGLLT